jgi:K+ transporter
MIILILFILLVFAIFLSGHYEAFSDKKDRVSGINIANDALYKERIKNKVPPPNVYMTDEMEYTPETVMANVNDVRQMVQRYQTQLPNMVSSCLQDNIMRLNETA